MIKCLICWIWGHSYWEWVPQPPDGKQEKNGGVLQMQAVRQTTRTEGYPVKRERTLRAIGFRGEVWQGEIRVATVEGGNFAQVNAETAHYAMMYGRDGPVRTKITQVRKKKRK